LLLWGWFVSPANLFYVIMALNCLKSRIIVHPEGEISMDIAIIGLGKMGGNIAQRLLKGGPPVVRLGQSAEWTRKLAALRIVFGGHAVKTKPS
jgi:hypothetical protein